MILVMSQDSLLKIYKKNDYMKYIVTGGAGFIGNNIVKLLINNGHLVTVVDNLCSGKIENLTSVKNEINFENIDILNFDKLESILCDCDGIFHQAALTSVPESFQKKKHYFDVNVNGTKNIFEIAKKYNIRVVYASSSSVYGNPNKIPIKENFDRKAFNPYAETKLESELLAEKFAKNGLNVLGLRYFNVYGTGQTGTYAGVITQFLRKLKEHNPPIINGDGKQLRDFIHVEDVAKANLVAMENQVNNGFFNVGTGYSISIVQLAKIMIDISGLELTPKFTPLPQGDVKLSQSDTINCKKLLGWESSITLKEGLAQLFQNN
jgi:UDP-glucose 4-epimerase